MRSAWSYPAAPIARCPCSSPWRPGRLRQILTNLVGNAIKFTQTGEVAVRALLEQETESDCILRFSVRDTGIGIPEDKISLLFGTFSQVDSSITRKYGGTGLGLAISKQLATMMGGEVGATSEVGKGSQFWCTVRLEKQLHHQLHMQTGGRKLENRMPAVLRGVRALIVDDNATSRKILTTMMTSLGMRPAEVEGGPSALKAIYQALRRVILSGLSRSTCKCRAWMARLLPGRLRWMSA